MEGLVWVPVFRVEGFRYASSGRLSCLGFRVLVDVMGGFRTVHRNSGSLGIRTALCGLKDSRAQGPGAQDSRRLTLKPLQNGILKASKPFPRPEPLE